MLKKKKMRIAYQQAHVHTAAIVACLNYVLDLRSFVIDKFPDNGTLVPKHVGVATWYEVCFVIFCTVF